VIIFCNQI